MGFASFTDLIRPVGSVYFSTMEWDLNPSEVFGGTWVNSGTAEIQGTIFNVWHRTA